MGMIESSRVLSLQRQGRVKQRQQDSVCVCGEGSGCRVQVGGRGAWVPAFYFGRRKARHSPVLDQTYDLGVCLPNDALPVHLHQPVS